MEVLSEWSRLPKMDSRGGKFFGAPYRNVEPPTLYARRFTITADEQAEFLGRFAHPRFDELRKATGANQRQSKSWRNMLLDAFHIWCAEHNKCSYFLTLDMKLIRSMQNSKFAAAEPKLVLPSELLDAVQ